MKKSAILLFFFLIPINTLFSQTLNFYGTVIDKISNQPIDAASVEIIDLSNGSRYVTQSTSNGNWLLNISNISQTDILPLQFSLEQNYPNPFNPSTKIGFSLNKQGNIVIRVHNILGQEMDHKSYYLAPGVYSIDWFSKGSSAVLFYSIEMEGVKISKKMVQIEGGNGGLENLTILGTGKNFIGSKDNLNKSNLQNYKIYVSKIGYVPDSAIITSNSISPINFDLETVHHSAFVIDLHNDLLERTVGMNYNWGERHTYNDNDPDRIHTDIPRLIEGGVDAQIFAVWVDPTKDSNYYNKSINFANTFNQQVNINSDKIGQAKKEDEVLTLNSQSKIAGIIGVEGGHVIEDNISKLINLYNLGMRYLTITWNNSTNWAISAQDLKSKTVGLSEFGKQVINTLDSLGVIIDVSHVGIKTIEDILAITKNPIIASHSGVYNLRPNVRNLTDDQIKAIAARDGVIGVVFYPPFLVKSGATVDSVIKHIDYIVKLVGIDYVAIGSDFDGIESTPIGLEDVSKFPNLTLALLKKGYSIPDVKKILGENFMRVFRRVCK
jgi:membrane dipeptidase